MAETLSPAIRSPFYKTHAELGATFIPFTAQTRMSGIDMPDGTHIRKGASDAIVKLVRDQGGGHVVPHRPRGGFDVGRDADDRSAHRGNLLRAG